MLREIRGDLYGEKVWVAIISSDRPGNMRGMWELVGGATWYVGDRQARYYEMARELARLSPTETQIVESGKLCESRNAAIKDAQRHGVPCVELSDDLRKIEWKSPHEDKPLGIAFEQAIRWIREEMVAIGAHLGGVAPTSNPFFARSETRDKAFIVGDFIVIDDHELLFDEQMCLKEDYDYTLQHIQKHEKVCRLDYVLATFLHRTNKGGAVSDRTGKKELDMIDYLKKKWGTQVIRPSGRNEYEIRLNL